MKRIFKYKNNYLSKLTFDNNLDRKKEELNKL